MEAQGSHKQMRPVFLLTYQCAAQSVKRHWMVYDFKHLSYQKQILTLNEEKVSLLKFVFGDKYRGASDGNHIHLIVVAVQYIESR